MKPSGGMWLLVVGAIYILAAVVNVYVYKFTEFEYIQIMYILVLMLPLVVPLLASKLNMRVLWEKE